jgi:hypothetical protein
MVTNDYDLNFKVYLVLVSWFLDFTKKRRCS